MVIINLAILYFQKPGINHTCAHPVVKCPNWKNLYFELNGSIVLAITTGIKHQWKILVSWTSKLVTLNLLNFDWLKSKIKNLVNFLKKKKVLNKATKRRVWICQLNKKKLSINYSHVTFLISKPNFWNNCCQYFNGYFAYYNFYRKYNKVAEIFITVTRYE